jgi:cytochrome c biogenesis protein CcmG, thiol:disulfide interchange protein DsbE
MWIRQGWILLMVGTLVVLGTSLTMVRERGDDTVPDVRPEVGHLAPDFTLPDLDGETVRLSDFRGNKAVFLNFWATWCAPCRLEMPTMEEVYHDYKGRNLEILAVSLDAGPQSAVKHFMRELKLTYPALLDPDMEVLRLYRMFSIPASFLIDKEGIIRFKELGYRDWTDPESRKLLEAILP